jgi:hypothetical protein
MIKITEERAMPVTIPHADYYVSDHDYVLLTTDADVRKKLLESLGVTSVVIDRLGKEVVPDSTYEKVEKVIRVPSAGERKEWGYHHRI